VATISKALKDSHEISPETKERVLKLARELNYTPNPYASSLRHRGSKTIAVVLPEVADSFFSMAINGIESVAQEKGYHVLVYLTHEQFEKEISILKDFQNGRVDGVLLSISSTTCEYNHLHKLYEENMPLVFFDRVCEEINTAKVQTDDTQAGYIATNHLLEKGCKRIAFLSMNSNLSITKHRLQGYLDALAEAGVDKSNQVVVECNSNDELSYAIIKQVLESDRQIDGVIGSVEKLATMTYSVCEELMIKIPQQVKVLAFSNLQIAALLNPSLTTITQPAFEIGKTAATLLFRSLEKRNFNLKDERVSIPSLLFERKSTA
jgi:LacI family transcriptional regulator